MRTPAVLLLVLAVAAAELGWKPNNEYRYHVISKTLTSLRQVGNQYSGAYIRALLTINAKSENHLIARLSEAQISSLQVEIPEGPEGRIPEEGLKWETMPLTSEPFEIKLKNAIVNELIISRKVPVWEVNIIRAIVSQFQVDTQSENLNPSKLNSLPTEEQNFGVYKTMEDTVDGKCEVVYDVSPLPQYMWQSMPALVPQPQLAEDNIMTEIVKTKNFSHCELRPVYHFGFPGSTKWEPASGQMGEFLARSSVSRIVISGTKKSYTIQSSLTTNKIILSPEIYNEQKGEVFSQLNVTLSQVKPVTEALQGPSNPQTIHSLVYDYSQPIRSDEEIRQRWDERREKSSSLLNNEDEKRPLDRPEMDNMLPQKQNLRKDVSPSSSESSYHEVMHQPLSKISETPNVPLLPFFIGDFGHLIAKDIDAVKVVKKLAEEIGLQLLNPSEIPKEHTLERFTILTDVIRTMSEKQLEQATKELYFEEHMREVESQKAFTWMVWRDAVAQAGTGPALLVIKIWIEEGKVHGEEAAQIVSGLPYAVRQPNTDYLTEFFKLLKSPKVTEDSRLNVTVVFAFSDLVRMSQVDEKTAHNRYPVHTFGQMKLRNNRDVEDIYIPYLAKQLQHAIELKDSQKIQVYTRALGNVAHPKIVQVFEPYLEGTKPMTTFQRTLVVVSFNKLATLYPRLTRSVLYKIYANKAEAYQVRVAAIYNLMKTNPPASMLQRMAQDSIAELSPQVSSAVASALQSAAELTGHENVRLREHAQAAVDLLPTQEYPVQYSKQNFTDFMVSGIDLGYTQTQKYFGSRDNLIPHGIFYHLRQNLNGLKRGMGVGAMVTSVSDLFLQDIFTQGFELPQKIPTETEWSYDKIMKTLNLEPKLQKQVEGNILLHLASSKRFYAFDNTTLRILAQEIHKLLPEALAKGRTFNYQTMYLQDEVILAFPTATGLPFVYTLSQPTLVSVHGKVKAVIEEDGKPSRKIKGEVSLRATFSSQVQARLSIVVPFQKKQYTAGHNRNIHVSIPIRAEVELVSADNKLQIQWQPASKQVQQKEQRILHYSTIPFTSQQDILSFKPLAEEQTTKYIQVREPQQMEHVFTDKVTGMAFRVKGLTEQTHMDFKAIYDHIRRYDVISALAYPFSKSTIERNCFDLFFDTQKSTVKSITMVGRYVKSQESRVEEGLSDEETNRAIPDSLTFDSEERRQQFLMRARSGIQGAVSHVVDLGIKIESTVPVQWVATAALSRSAVDEKSRLLVFTGMEQEGRPYQIALDVASRMPFVSTSSLQEALQDKQKGQVRAKVNYGEKAKGGSEITISATLDKSDERRQYLQVAHQQLEKKQGKQRARAVFVAGSWDKYDINVQYLNVGDSFKNITYQTYSVLRHLGYPYMSENPIKPHQQDGHIQAQVKISPKLDTADISVFTPVGDVRFTNIRLNRYLADVATIHPQMSIAKKTANALFGHYQSTCIFEKNQISTFNSLEYPALLGETWHVLMISRPQMQEQPRVVVLGRQTSEQTQEVKLILSDDTVLVVTPKRNSDPKEPQVIVSINKEVIPLSKGIIVERKYNNQHSRVLIKALPNGEVDVSAREVELIHDGERVHIQSRMGYMNQLRGLCGPHNGEKRDFIAPKEFLLENPEEFVATWALSHEGRIGEMQKRAEERSNIRWRIMPGNYVSEQDAGRSDKMGRPRKTDSRKDFDYSSSSSTYASNESHEELRKRSSTGCAIQRIQVLERDGQHCFSLLPQPTCAHQCHAETTKTRTTKFYCVPKSTTSEHWAERVLRGSVPDFSNKGNAQDMQFEAPVKCRR